MVHEARTIGLDEFSLKTKNVLLFSHLSDCSHSHTVNVFTVDFYHYYSATNIIAQCTYVVRKSRSGKKRKKNNFCNFFRCLLNNNDYLYLYTIYDISFLVNSNDLEIKTNNLDCLYKYLIKYATGKL